MTETAVVERLTTYMMLGRIFNERLALTTASRAVPVNPDEWEDSRLTTILWADDFGEDMAEKVPLLIEQHGQRPARAVATLIQHALRYGIEVGRQLERQGAESA